MPTPSTFDAFTVTGMPFLDDGPGVGVLAKWTTEELQRLITLLQSENRSQQKLNEDLMSRIEALENPE